MTDTSCRPEPVGAAIDRVGARLLHHVGEWVPCHAGTMAVLWFRGNRWVSGTMASVFMGVMPVSALVLPYLLLDEPFEWVHLVGMATVLAGLAIISWTDGSGH